MAEPSPPACPRCGMALPGHVGARAAHLNTVHGVSGWAALEEARRMVTVEDAPPAATPAAAAVAPEPPPAEASPAAPPTSPEIPDPPRKEAPMARPCGHCNKVGHGRAKCPELKRGRIKSPTSPATTPRRAAPASPADAPAAGSEPLPAGWQHDDDPIAQMRGLLDRLARERGQHETLRRAVAAALPELAAAAGETR